MKLEDMIMKSYSNLNDLLADDSDRVILTDPPKQQNQQIKQAASYRQRKSRKRYRIVPLVLFGLICCALFIAIGCFIWSITAYFTQTDVALSVGQPLFIFFIAVLLSSALMTLIIRGGKIFPVLALAVIAFIVNLIITNYLGVNINITSALLKLLIILLAAVFGFSAGKILSMSLYKKKPNR